MVYFKTLILTVLWFCKCLCRNVNTSELEINNANKINQNIEIWQPPLSDNGNKKKSVELTSFFDVDRASKTINKTFTKKDNLETSYSPLNFSKYTNETMDDKLNDYNKTLELESNSTIINNINNHITNNKDDKTVYDNVNSNETNILCNSMTESETMNCSKPTVFLKYPGTLVSHKIEPVLGNFEYNKIFNNKSENSLHDIPKRGILTIKEVNINILQVTTIGPNINKFSENILRRPKNKTVFVNGNESIWPVKHAVILEGDVVLGGLMMVHSREDSVTCGPVMPQGGVQALEAMLYTLDVINSNKLLPGITLGAHVLDDCDTDTYGLEIAVDFIKVNK